MHSKNVNGLRVIQTGRTLESINESAKKGFKPLVKQVVPNPSIHSKFAVLQHRQTGEIEIIGDFRMTYRMDNIDEYEMVINWQSYYPHKFPNPYAAYLLPQNLKVGERVFLEDLIEDLVEARWNQGDTYRLRSAEAIWNGKDFEIQFNPKEDMHIRIG